MWNWVKSLFEKEAPVEWGSPAIEVPRDSKPEEITEADVSTPELMRQIRQRCEQSVRNLYGTEPVDHDKAQQAMSKLYALFKLPPPVYVWFPSPSAALPAMHLAALYDGVVGSISGDGMVTFETVERRMRHGAAGNLRIAFVNYVLASQNILYENEAETVRGFSIFEEYPGLEAMDIITPAANRTYFGMPPEFPNEWKQSWKRIADSIPSNGNSSVRSTAKLLHQFLERLSADYLYYFQALHRKPEKAVDLAFGPGTRSGANTCQWLIGRMKPKGLDEFLAVSEHCGWWHARKDICIMIERPTKCAIDNAARLHQVDGPAIEYADGFSVYALHGIAVTKQIAHGEVTVRDIESQQNTEIRRVMIERYGMERYITEGGMEVVKTDEYGILYRKYMGNGEEPLAVVRVRNSTPEPDGSFKEYFLRVPPDVGSPRQAVAWTFDLPEHMYQPTKES